MPRNRRYSTILQEGSDHRVQHTSVRQLAATSTDQFCSARRSVPAEFASSDTVDLRSSRHHHSSDRSHCRP